MSNNFEKNGSHPKVSYMQPCEVVSQEEREGTMMAHGLISRKALTAGILEVIEGTTHITDDADNLFCITKVDLMEKSSAIASIPFYKKEKLFDESIDADLYISADNNQGVDNINIGWVAMALRVAQARALIRKGKYNGSEVMVRLSPPGVGLGVNFNPKELEHIAKKGTYHYNGEPFETTQSINRALVNNNIFVKNIFGGGENTGFAASFGSALPKDTLERVHLYPERPVSMVWAGGDFVLPDASEKFIDRLANEVEDAGILNKLQAMHDEYSQGLSIASKTWEVTGKNRQKPRKYKQLESELLATIKCQPGANYSILLSAKKESKIEQLQKSLGKLIIFLTTGNDLAGNNVSTVIASENLALSMPTVFDLLRNSQE